MPIEVNHLNAFINTIPQFQNQGSFGHNPKNFLNGIIKRIGVNNTSTNLIQIQNILPNSLLNRSSVFNICNNKELSLAYKVVCVFAWGAMRQAPGVSDLFFMNWENYENDLDQIIKNFQSDIYSRNWAYEKMKRMNMRGCRPAYYTKLIFFFGSGNSYIMDQWTSKSIELFWSIDDRIGIIFDNNGNYIQANNHSGIYEEFCCRVEALTTIVNSETNSKYSPIQIEEMIFSNGANLGQKKGNWRTYVELNWQNTKFK
jgi:hypothetical protein